MTSDEQEVRRLDRAWNEVYLRNDRGALAEILASDFRGLLPDGRSIGRAELMEPTEPRRVEFSELEVLLFGPAALTRGRVRIEHPEGPAEQRFVRIYAKRDGVWRAVAVQVFPVEPARPLRVERAKPEDAAAVHALFEEAAAWLTARGIRQWAPGEYPGARVAASVARGETFVVRNEGGGLAATLQLLDADPGIWGPDEVSALYLHRLVVARRRATTGLGRELLDWALGEARARGRAFLRLDCVASNEFLRRYYAAAGFSERGEARWRDLALTRFERPVPQRP